MNPARDPRFNELDQLIEQGKGNKRDLTPLRKPIQRARVGRPPNLPTDKRKNKSTIDWERVAAKFILPQRATLERITRIVEQAYDYPESTLRDVVSNEPKYVHARQICFYLCRMLTNSSYPQLGRHFKANHSTIVYGCNQVRGCMEHSRELLELIQSLVAEIKSDPNWFQRK